MEIRKALYGLKQSGALAAKKLAADLAPFGYQKVPFTTGLWKHVSRPITFTLVVDDFGVKYVNKEDAEHLESALKSNYPITTDWSGNKYIGVNLDWNYKRKNADINARLCKKGSETIQPLNAILTKTRFPLPLYSSKIWLLPTPNDTNR